MPDLVFCVCEPLWAIGGIGDGANIGNERVYVRLSQCVSVRRHFRRLIQGWTAVADDGSQIRIAHRVQQGTFRESVRLGRQIVVIGDAFRSGFRIVTARAIVVVQDASKLLLITESDFVQPEFHGLARLVASRPPPGIGPRCRPGSLL